MALAHSLTNSSTPSMMAFLSSSMPYFFFSLPEIAHIAAAPMYLHTAAKQASEAGSDFYPLIPCCWTPYFEALA